MLEKNTATKGLNLLQIKNFEDFSDVAHKRPLNIERFKLDYHKHIEKPPLAVMMNGAHFGSLGNISLILGKAKSRKTFLGTMLMAAALKNSTELTDIFKHYLPREKRRVVFIDTEQSEYDAKVVSERVLRLNNTEKLSNFDVYTLRAASVEERVEIIEHILANQSDIGLLVIDGIRDLVHAINDEKEASYIVNKLMKWSTDHSIHITVVLHQNKSDNNARGHLGTELQNKSETTISVRKDKDDILSIVSAEYCRQEEPEEFAFFIDDDSLPRVLEGYQQAASKQKKRKLEPHTEEVNTHLSVLTKLQDAANNEKLGYTATVDLLQIVGKNMFSTFGDTKAKGFLKYYCEQGWIKRMGASRSPNAHYVIHLDKVK